MRGRSDRPINPVRTHLFAVCRQDACIHNLSMDRRLLAKISLSRTVLLLALGVGAHLTHAQSAGSAITPITVESVQAWTQEEAQTQFASIKGARIQVQVGTINPRLSQAPCAQLQFSVVQGPGQGQRLWGRSAVMARCAPDSGWFVRIPVTVRIWAPALVAARTVSALAPIRPEDVRSTEVELTREPQGVATEFVQIDGRVSMRMVNVGQPIALVALRAPQVVNQGDPVKVMGQGQGFAIATEAVAMGSALEGQSVRVRTESGRVLTGIARSGRIVEVNF